MYTVRFLCFSEIPDSVLRALYAGNVQEIKYIVLRMHTNLSSSILSNSVKNPLNCQLFVHQNILLCAHVKLILLIMEVIHVSGNPGNMKSSP